MDTEDPCGNCPKRSNEAMAVMTVDGGTRLLEIENPRSTAFSDGFLYGRGVCCVCGAAETSDKDVGRRSNDLESGNGLTVRERGVGERKSHTHTLPAFIPTTLPPPKTAVSVVVLPRATAGSRRRRR